MIYVDARPRCTTCKGHGDVRGEPFCPTGCTCFGKLHGFRDAVCPDCGGEGFVGSGAATGSGHPAAADRVR